MCGVKWKGLIDYAGYMKLCICLLFSMTDSLHVWDLSVFVFTFVFVLFVYLFVSLFHCFVVFVLFCFFVCLFLFCFFILNNRYRYGAK